MRNFRECFSLFFLFFLILMDVFGQTSIKRKYYHADGQLKRNVNFDESSLEMTEVKIIGGSMIDPYRNNQIHLPTVERYLNLLFPIKNSEGILCVDLENQIYRDVRDNQKTKLKFKNAERNFVDLVSFIKEKRPNLKLGIYGMPFPVYYNNQEKRNYNRKLDNILKDVDIIFPSLYIQYPAVEKGKESNHHYLKRNLQIASEYANRLNKKVMPFMWYLVHPSNRRYGNSLLGKEEFGNYVDYVWKAADELNCEIEGIVIWNSPTPFVKGQIKHDLLGNESKQWKQITAETILKEYQSILR